jgi:hypothetical protein
LTFDVLLDWGAASVGGLFQPVLKYLPAWLHVKAFTRGGAIHATNV